MKQRHRYAPSPTGALHLGNVRTALLAWLYARAQGGVFVLRMEDLDPQRSSKPAAIQILDDLRWLGLDWDEGPDVGGAHFPYTQSDRAGIYAESARRLLADGRAFRCTCTRAEVARAVAAPHIGEEGPRYPGTCRAGPSHPDRPSSLRLRVEPGVVPFRDEVHGPQSLDVSLDLGDFVIQRADGVAAYQLACGLDDALMGITHVLRADDLLTSTPRQILVQRALGLESPTYAHVPLLVGADGHRLAKRSGSLTIQALRERGATPGRVLGWLAATAGLGDGAPRTAASLVAGFSLDTVGRAPVVVRDSDLDSLVGT